MLFGFNSYLHFHGRDCGTGMSGMENPQILNFQICDRFFLRIFSVLQIFLGFLLIYQGMKKFFFAKIRYTWPLLGQNQLHAGNKYKTHPRSPAIGHADIVTHFGSK